MGTLKLNGISGKIASHGTLIPEYRSKPWAHMGVAQHTLSSSHEKGANLRGRRDSTGLTAHNFLVADPISISMTTSSLSMSGCSPGGSLLYSYYTALVAQAIPISWGMSNNLPWAFSVWALNQWPSYLRIIRDIWYGGLASWDWSHMHNSEKVLGNETFSYYHFHPFLLKELSGKNLKFYLWKRQSISIQICLESVPYLLHT